MRNKPIDETGRLRVGCCTSYKKKINYFRNAISKLYDAVSSTVAARRDALKEIVANYLRLISVGVFPCRLSSVPEDFKTVELREFAVSKEPFCLKYVPDMFITQEMCGKAVSNYPRCLNYIPDKLKTIGMC